MNTAASEHDPLAPLADEFLERARRGEQVSPEEYAAKHPELASQIHDLFPALLVMENLGGSAAGDVGTPAPSFIAAPPKKLGEYRILRQVGRGGMGVVYEAVQESLGRHVALKVLPPNLAERGTFLERFRREAKAAARLHHTNIVPVFGVGESDGTHYYAMQFIHGQGLDKVLDDVRRLRAKSSVDGADTATAAPSLALSLLTGQFHAPDATETPTTVASIPDSQGSNALSAGKAGFHYEAARLGAQAADALAHAHAQGILHRDVKPSNLLLDAQGTLWVTDFGLAKSDDGAALTDTGDIVGTLRYMPPERFNGQGDARADVYGLGATLYELLTLRPAFDDTDRVALVGRIAREGPRPPRECDPALPRDLETIVLKAMARDPADRYASAADLGEDLRRFIADRPIRARRHSWPEQLRRWSRRNPAVAGLSAAVALLLLVLTAGALVHSFRLNRALGESETHQQVAKAAERERTVQLFNARLAEARAGRFSRRVGQRYETLATIREAARLARDLQLPAERFDELRDVAVAALALSDFRPLKVWDVTRGPANVAFDDRLAIYARANLDGRLRVHRVADDVELASLECLSGEGLVMPLMSGDGHFVAAYHWVLQRVKWWDLRESPPREVKDLTSIRTAALSNDGRLCAVKMDGSLTTYDLATGAARATFRGGAPATNAVFDGAGKRLAVRRGDAIDILDAGNGSTLRTIADAGSPHDIVWNPNGRQLVVTGDADRLRLFDVETGRLVHEFGTDSGGGFKAAFNRLGDRLIRAGWSRRLRLWDVPTGRLLLETNGDFYPPGFAADDSAIAGHIEGQHGLFETPIDRVLSAIARDATTIFREVNFSPDNRWFAVGSDDGSSIYAVGADQPAAFLHRGYAPSPSFLPDGTLLDLTQQGAQRWPATPTRDGLRLGPPQRMAPAIANRSFRHSHDGRVFANGRPDGAVVTFADRPGHPLWLLPHPDVRNVSVSPDGRFVVTGGWSNLELRVWDADSGEPLKTLSKTSGQNGSEFSPDGRRLFTSSDGATRCWSVGDWQELPAPPDVRGFPAFNGDGSLLAMRVTDRSGFVGLFDGDGRPLVRLEDPDHTVAQNLALSGNGATLVITAGGHRSLRVWDLRALRRGLAELDLDWAAPPLPPPPGGSMRLEVVGAEATADLDKLLNRGRADLIARLAANPLDAEAHLRLGMIEVERRRYGQGIIHLSAAVALGREDAVFARAQAGHHLRRWADVDADARRILARRPTDLETLMIRADALLGLARPAEAAEVLTQVIRRIPDVWQLVDMRAACYAAMGDTAREMADREAALGLGPTVPAGINRCVWPLVRQPGARTATLARALQLMERAVQEQPSDAMLVNTLGVTQYRNHQYAEAVATFTKSMGMHSGAADGFDLFFRAMCHYRLGDAAQAAKDFELAARWCDANKNLSPLS